MDHIHSIDSHIAMHEYTSPKTNEAKSKNKISILKTFNIRNFAKTSRGERVNRDEGEELKFTPAK